MATTSSSSSKSAKTDVDHQQHRPAVVENAEQRHAVANVPMQIPEGSFQVVPGVFVAGKAALPRLIEFFNVTHVVRCIETEPQQRARDRQEAESQKKLYETLAAKKKNKEKKSEEEEAMDEQTSRVVEVTQDDDDEATEQQQKSSSSNTNSSPPAVDAAEDDDILITIGGTIAQPYGSGIPYPKNVFHCPIRDSIDETEFLSWARKASEFIANTLRIEEEDEVTAAMAEGKEEGNDANDDDDDNNKPEDGGDDDGSGGRKDNSSSKSSASKKKKRSHFDAFSNNNQEIANTASDQDHHVHSENCGCGNQNNAQEAVEERRRQEESDAWAQFRERAPGTVVIHCEKGRSRSPAVAMAYLILKRNMTLQEAMDMFEFDGEDNEEGSNSNNNRGEYQLQLNPIFVLELAKLEAEVHGSPLFDLDGYWLQRLQQLFPKVPTATIAKELAAAGGNMLAAREKLMGVAARQFFDRDALMVDALHNIMIRTVEEYRVAKNMRIPESAKTPGDVVTKDECAKYFKESDKKRDVALMKLTNLLKERMTIH